MNINDYIDKTFKSKTFGKVKVLGRVPNSRTLLEVECIDRGKGWSKKTQTYKGYTNSVGWMRGENRDFGKKDTIHKNDLN